MYCIFNLFCIIYIPIFLVSCVEQMEYYDKYRNWLLSKDGELNKVKMVSIRIIFGLIVMGITFISNDVVKITNFSGNLFNPVVSLLIPMFCKYSWAFQIKKKYNIFVYFHDGILTCSTIIIAAYSTYYNIADIAKSF